jgi:hypothetical protein
MVGILEQYAQKFEAPGYTVEYPDTPAELEKASKALAPSGVPSYRKVNDKIVYSADGNLMGIPNVAEWVLKAGQTHDERIETALALYHQKLEEQIANFEQRYDEELQKIKGFFSSWDLLTDLERLLDNPDKDYLLLLGQYLKDLKAVQRGSGIHCLAAELKILLNYIHYGKAYLQPYQAAETDMDTGRAIEAPDENLVMYASGYQSDWQSAVREAWYTAYKLGYPLRDIYVFNYSGKGVLQLSEVVGRNGRFVGDFKLILELDKKIHDADEKEKLALQQLREELLRNSPNLQNWLFTRDDNLDSTLPQNALRLADQLREVIRKNPGRKVNLIASSQGTAIMTGFLLQKRADGAYIMDNELKQAIEKYAFTVPAFGGAYLAQARMVADQTGMLIKLASPFAKEVNAQITQDLAINSDFTLATYAALQEPDTLNNLAGLSGITVYAANDDVTTSIPLAHLPTTLETKMVDGRHTELAIGLGDATVCKCNKYIHNSLSGKIMFDLESDKLIYSGYLKKGLPDFDILPPNNLIDQSIRNGLVPFLTGRAGVIDYDIMQKVLGEIHEEHKLSVKPFGTNPTFDPFIP